MSLDLSAAPLVVVAVLFGLGTWGMVRRVTRRTNGPLADVPDAAPTAEPIAAPGMTVPYSSVDPYAAPKRRADGSRVDGLPESE